MIGGFLGAGKTTAVAQLARQLTEEGIRVGLITNDRKSARRSIKEVIAEARNLLDKQDDAFEGMIDDNAFIDGWFAVRKIKGRHKPHVKNEKGLDENN